MARGHRSACFQLLSTCRFVEFGTPAICSVFMQFLGSFLLQDMCLNYLTFRMLQHTSSEVIIIQLQINLNSKIQLYGLGTNEID